MYVIGKLVYVDVQQLDEKVSTRRKWYDGETHPFSIQQSLIADIRAHDATLVTDFVDDAIKYERKPANCYSVFEKHQVGLKTSSCILS